MSNYEEKHPVELVVLPIQPVEKKFIFVITKNIDDEQLELLKEYGKVIIFDNNIYNNINVSSIDFEFLILDIREKGDREYLQKIENMDSFYLISICHSFERFEEYHAEMRVNNILTKLPAKQAYKSEFIKLLLQKKISKPSVALSCYKSFIRLVKGNWK